MKLFKSLTIVLVLFFVFSESKAQNKYLQFGTSTGSLNTSAGVSSYYYPSGLSLSSTMQGQINPGSLRPYRQYPNFFLPTSVNQSSIDVYQTLGGTDFNATLIDLYDNDYTTGARTTGDGTIQTITIDLGQATYFSDLQIAAITAANLNGAALQTSTDNVNWTTVISTASGTPLSNITTATNTGLVTLSFTPVTAQYVRFTRNTGKLDLSEFRVLPIVSQSSGTVLGTYTNLYDNAVTAAATTLAATAGQWVMQDLGCNRTFMSVKLSAVTVASLNGAEIQVSTNGTTWTSISSITNSATGTSGATIAGASAVYPITFTFASQTARYIRVYKSTASVVETSEFQVGPRVSGSSATTLALYGNSSTIDDASYTTGFTTTATAGVTQWAMVNLGTSKTFSHVQLATITAATNLDGSLIQTSSDGITWTTQVTVSGSSTTELRAYIFPAPVTAQYVRVIRASTGSALMISEFLVSPGVTLSSGAKPALANYGNLYDNAIAAATTTASGTNQYVMLDLGSNKTFSNVQIAAATAVGNLDGAALQVSSDAVTWTTLTINNSATGVSGTTFSGSSIVYPITYNFASQTARYIRVFRSATGIVSLGEFRVGSAVFQSSATTLANNAVYTQFTDGTYTTGTLTNVVAGVNQFVGLNFQAAKTFNSIEIAPHTAIINLDGATLQVSNDGVTWTSVTSLTNVTTGISSATVTGSILSTKRTYTFASQTASFVRLIKLDGTVLGVSEFKVGSVVSQSSGTQIGTSTNLSDNSAAAAAVTTTGANQWVMVDLGSTQSFNFVQLATSGAVTNLDGAELQVSTDGTTWTTLTTKNNRTGVTGATISGSSIAFPDVFSFATTSARYLRVFRAASGIVAVSEFRVSPAVYQSSGTTYATATNFNDDVLSTAAGQTSAGTVSNPAFIGLNLGTSKTFSAVEITTTAIANLNGAVLEASDDFLTWTTLIPSISGMVANQINVLTFASTTAKYVRVRSTSLTLTVSEFKVVNGISSTKKLIASGVTNTASALENIGFTFNFKGVNYSKYSVNSNGLLRLGTTVVTTESVNNFDSPTNTPILFAYWDAISTGNAATNGGVTSTITGASPNRKLIVEWRCGNTTTVGTTNIVFQVVLYEGTNKVEYIYGNGVNNTTNASIGIALGATAGAREFYSVTPNATLANTTYSNMTPNDFVTLWPGNGTVYTFLPTPLPVTAIVPTDFKTLDNAMGAVNWAQTPNTGGYTVTVNGGYTETVPVGYPTVPAGTTINKYSGLLLTATGTATNPIKIQWSGSGAKPILTANTGKGLNDYIIGIAGSDYVTIDGLKLNESAANIALLTNAAFTEIGIALFKKQVGTTTVGADGCQHNLIKNCDITLDRRTNGNISITTTNGYAQDLPMFSKGIGMVYWDHLLAGDNLSEAINGDCNSTGLLTANDVNSYNEFYSNTIDNCYYGFWANDRYKLTIIAATGNVFGKVGQGNTITNFGAYLGRTYTCNVTWTTHSTLVPKGVFFGVMKDASIVGNTITNGYANQYRVFGIEFGTFERGNKGLKNIGKVDINNNAISNLYANTAAPATNASDAMGIIFAPGNYWAKKQIATDNINIKDNSITGLFTKLGKAIGISTGPVYGDNAYTSYTDFSVIDGNGKTATIAGNTISTLKASGVTTSVIETVTGIYWGANYSTTYINSNSITGMELGDGTTNPGAASYLTGIVFAPANTAASRTELQINSNTISNNFGKSSTGTASQIVARMIHAKQGGLTTSINNNTIQGNDFTYARDSGNSGEGVCSSLIEAFAWQSGGTSTLNIKNNNLLNNYRRGMRAGTYNYFNGIYVNNTTKPQNQFIDGNTINGLEFYVASGAAASTNAILSGIRVKGNYTTITSTINNNTVTGLKADKLQSNSTYANASSATDINAFSMRGIIVDALKRVNITKNLVYNNTTLTTLGNIGTSTTASTYLDGNLGIGVIGSTNTTYKTNVYAVSNNYVYDLFAPSMNAPSAINGIFINKYGEFYVDHNTVVIGDPITPTPVTSSVTSLGVFGTSGVLYAPYSISNGNRNKSSAYEKYTFRNNIIAVQSTNKGTGASMAFRQDAVGTAKKFPGDITINTTGNNYYINEGTYNYLYGQGGIANITGGIRNSFAVSGATANTANNLIVSTDFNLPCSKYEQFMAGAEYTTTSDLIPALTKSKPQPFVGGSSNPGKYYITTGSTSYVFSPIKATSGNVTVSDDYVTTGSRPATNATAGAYQTTGVAQYSKTMTATFEQFDNTICSSSQSLVVNILKNVSTVSVATGSMAPRVYYKLSTNTNQVPGPTQNVSTFNGWKWVNATSISGSQYTFDLDYSKLNGTLTAPITIEYFVVIADDASYNSTRYFIISGTSLPFCINNVDLYASGGNSNTAQVPELDGGTPATLTASNSFDVLAASGYNRYTYNSADETRTAANTNNATAKIVCPNTTVKVKGFFNYASTGLPYEHPSYVFQASATAAFTTLLVSVPLTTPEYDYTIGAHTTNVYVRIVPTCSGSPVTGFESPYIYFTTIGCPLVTSNQANGKICVGVSKTFPLTNSNTGTAGIRQYFVQDSFGKAFYTLGTTTSTSANVVATANNPSTVGLWNATVGLVKNTISTGGYLQANLAANVDNQTTNLLEGTGINFTSTEYTKLNSVVLFDDVNDGVATSGFKVVLYDANTQTKLYETGTLSVTDGGTLTVSFTNWYIGTGNFNLVIESFDTATPMTGLLLSPASLATPLTVNYDDFPVSIGNKLSLNGGIDSNDVSTLSSAYNYFMNWNITTYCTDKPGNSFNVEVVKCVNCVPINPRITKRLGN